MKVVLCCNKVYITLFSFYSRIHIICKCWCRAVKRALLVVGAVCVVQCRDYCVQRQSCGIGLPWASTLSCVKWGTLSQLGSKSSSCTPYLKDTVYVENGKEVPASQNFSLIMETSLEIGSGGINENCSQNHEDELLAQDPPFRQHKYETGNYREEIMGCYFNLQF